MVNVGFPKQIPGISDIHIDSFQRNAGGNQAITGVGFVPKVLVFFGIGTGGVNQIASWGFDDATNARCTALVGDSVDPQGLGTVSIYVRIDALNFISGFVASMDSDGFTVTWSLTGTVTATVYYLAMR